MAKYNQHNDESSCESACSEDEYDGTCEDFNDDVPLHPLLKDDIKRLQTLYYESSLNYRVLEGITDMVLHINIPTDILERDTAAAWNLNHGEPLIVSISMDRKVYLDVPYFQKIEVCQASSTERVGAILQFQNIAHSFCQSSLRDLSNLKVSKAVSKYINIKNADILHLVEMGFPESKVIKALKATDGIKEDAVIILLHDQKEAHPKDALEVSSSRKPNSPCVGKEVPSLEDGFLVQFYQYLNQRLLTLNDYCPICDSPHDLDRMAMLKPYICHRELCIFSFTTLGLMSDVADSVTSSPKVIDLLIHLTNCAAFSQRHDIILTPFPAFVDPAKPTELAMHEKCKDIGLLRAVLAHMPHAADMVKYERKNMQAELAKHDSLCFPLLRWIIRSNRSYIVALPEHQQINLMGTKHQFLMRSMPPLEERNFMAKRAIHGSTFAFHGSPIENWHAIIREGLIVASGTKKQLHGAAHGKAIYLSPSLPTSMGYSGKNFAPNKRIRVTEDEHTKSLVPESDTVFVPEEKKDFLCGKLICIALCEVIKDKLIKNSENIWTCTESSNVCTRLFFVYDERNPPSMAQEIIHTEDQLMHSQIQRAVRDILCSEHETVRHF